MGGPVAGERPQSPAGRGCHPLHCRSGVVRTEADCFCWARRGRAVSSRWSGRRPGRRRLPGRRAPRPASSRRTASAASRAEADPPATQSGTLRETALMARAMMGGRQRGVKHPEAGGGKRAAGVRGQMESEESCWRSSCSRGTLPAAAPHLSRGRPSARPGASPRRAICYRSLLQPAPPCPVSPSPLPRVCRPDGAGPSSSGSAFAPVSHSPMSRSTRSRSGTPSS